MYYLWSYQHEKKETSVEIATYPVSPPQQDKNKENFNTLVKLTIEQAANAGNDDARFLLGQCYELLNTPQNMQTVLAYYRSSNSHAARNILDQYKIASVQGMNDVTFRYRINWSKETFIFDFMWEENIFFESEDGELVDKTTPKSISIEAQVQNLCFVEEIWADKNNNKIRLTLIPGNFDGENFDWRTKLLDLKGDGDFRYLIIADYHTGTAPDGCIGYVIDVKDSFKHIATIPVGESFDLPYYNPLLILNK